jgi:hypothetical protein
MWELRGSGNHVGNSVTVMDRANANKLEQGFDRVETQTPVSTT